MTNVTNILSGRPQWSRLPRLWTLCLPLLCLSLLVVVSCGDSGESNEADVIEGDVFDTTADDSGAVDDTEQVQIEVPTSPRTYRMGLQAFASERSFEAEQAVWSYVGGHADVAVVIFDTGIPWQELVDDAPFPPGFESELVELEGYMANTTADLYLAVDLFSPDRTGIAGDIQGRPLPDGFSGASAGNFSVTTAYTIFCERLVERFEPAYFSPVLDLNVYLQNRPSDYSQAVDFYKDLRESIKRIHFLTQVFPTWDLEILAGLGPVSDEEQFFEIRMLDANVDRLALSVRPAAYFVKLDTLTRDYIGRTEDLSSHPMVVMTAFPSIGFQSGPLIYSSSESSQYNYLAYILQDAEVGLYDLLVWRYPYDIDGYLEDLCPGRIDSPNTPCEQDTRFDYLRPHAYGGLLHGDDSRKTAADLWNDFYSRAYRAE